MRLSSFRFILTGISMVFCIGIFYFILSNQRFLQTKAQAQSCTPPLYQGFTSSCTVIPLRWLNRDPVTMIDHYEIYRSGIKIGEVPATAINFSDPVGCGFAASYTIVQINRNGGRCQTVTTGNLPHSRPCDQCQGDAGGGASGFKIVNAASFSEPVNGGSIVAIFPTGDSFGSQTQMASTIPLPTEMAGLRVTINGLPAGLFYVAPGQINALLPEVAAGQYQVNIALSSGQTMSSLISLSDNPGVFSALSNGNGPPAAAVTNDGINFWPVSSSGQPIPISAGTTTQPNFLILFGTGLRGTIQVRIAGEPCEVIWSGRSPTLAGLDQVNIRLNESLANRGLVNVLVTANGMSANQTVLNIQ